MNTKLFSFFLLGNFVVLLVASISPAFALTVDPSASIFGSSHGSVIGAVNTGGSGSANTGGSGSANTGGSGSANTGGTKTNTTGIGLENWLGKDATISSVLYSILNFLFYVAAPVLAIMILWGGFQILTAGGEPEKAATGRKTIMYAVIGYAIVFISFGVEALLKDIFSH